jgi:hypothetical protein
MRTSTRRGTSIAAVLLVTMAATAQAGSLAIVDVSFPQVNCVFNTNCTIEVSDSTGTIAMPFLNVSNTAWLQSRSFTGAAGTPAAGQTGYMYRISLTQASGFGDCLLGFVIDFGPIIKLPYKAGSPPADVFVASLGGGLGTIGLASAEQDGDIITFTLKKPLCVGTSPSNNATTFFIGLASSGTPKAIDGGVFALGSPPYYQVAARAPNH